MNSLKMDVTKQELLLEDGKVNCHQTRKDFEEICHQNG